MVRTSPTRGALPDPAPVDVSILLARLDVIVDRLEGVYERLRPYLEAQQGREMTPMKRDGHG